MISIASINGLQRFPCFVLVFSLNALNRLLVLTNFQYSILDLFIWEKKNSSARNPFEMS